MKKIYNLPIILLLSATVLITACTTISKSPTTEVVTLRDITEYHLSQPKADEILRLYGFDESQWLGGIFRFSDITQVSFNRTTQVKIESEPQLLSNRFQRQQKVEQFKKGIEDILSTAEQTPIGQRNSSVYFPMAQALNQLSQSSADKRYMLIYSDLMENEPGLSFYRKGKLSEIDEDADSLRADLENELPLHSLNGITIYLLYEPADVEQDSQYKIVSKFYKGLFESKGATVKIVPSITS